jgi:hypothetical protein
MLKKLSTIASSCYICNWSIEKVNSSYRVNAIYKQKFNAKTLIFAYF